MLQAVFEYSSIKITDDLLMGAETIRQASPPFSFIIFNKLICFWVARREAEPVKFAVAMFLPVHKLAQIKVSIRINLNPVSVFLISIELTFINFAFLRYIDAFSFPFFVSDHPEVDLPIVLDQLKLRVLNDFLKGEPFLREELVMRKEIAKLLLRHCPYALHVPLFLDGMNSKDLNVKPLLVFMQVSVFLRVGKSKLGVFAFFIAGLHNKNQQIHHCNKIKPREDTYDRQQQGITKVTKKEAKVENLRVQSIIIIAQFKKSTSFSQVLLLSYFKASLQLFLHFLRRCSIWAMPLSHLHSYFKEQDFRLIIFVYISFRPAMNFLLESSYLSIFPLLSMLKSSWFYLSIRPFWYGFPWLLLLSQSFSWLIQSDTFTCCSFISLTICFKVLFSSQQLLFCSRTMKTSSSSSLITLWYSYDSIFVVLVSFSISRCE